MRKSCTRFFDFFIWSDIRLEMETQVLKEEWKEETIQNHLGFTGTLWPTFNVFCKVKWESNAFINPCTWLLVVWDFWRLFSNVSQCFNVKFTKLGMSRDWTMWLSEEQQLQFPNCCSLEECCNKTKHWLMEPSIDESTQCGWPIQANIQHRWC